MNIDISIIHTAKQLYKNIYHAGKKLPKPDKLGIHLQIENLTREILQNVIKAAFTDKEGKLYILKNITLSLEVMKHFIRMENELHIIDEKTYIRLETTIVEISKMTNGWIKFLRQKSPQ